MLSESLTAVTARAFRAGSAVRGAKVFHPRGVAFTATVVIDGGPDAPASPWLRTPGEFGAVARFSRGAGLPKPLPDLLGLAVRVLDAHGPGRPQDLLMITSIDAPVLHHLFVPAFDAQARPYSSATPYRIGGTSWLMGATPRDDSPRGVGGAMEDRLRSAAATGDLALDLGAARVGGRFRRFGELRVGDPVPGGGDHLRFNLFNTGGGLEPVTWVNRIRRQTYQQSQEGWEA